MASYGAVSHEFLFRRCVTGCGEESPPCPDCAATGQICSLVTRTCEACQMTRCVDPPANPTPLTNTSDNPSKSGPNVGAIAGGVIGGVLLIAVVTYLVWRFCIKTKRQQYEQEDWTEDPSESIPTEKDFTLRRDARASTHTVASIASTVLTRASNIIQIAYIPSYKSICSSDARPACSSCSPDPNCIILRLKHTKIRAGTLLYAR